MNCSGRWPHNNLCALSRSRNEEWILKVVEKQVSGIFFPRDSNKKFRNSNYLWIIVFMSSIYYSHWDFAMIKSLRFYGFMINASIKWSLLFASMTSFKVIKQSNWIHLRMHEIEWLKNEEIKPWMDKNVNALEVKKPRILACQLCKLLILLRQEMCLRSTRFVLF